ncbi:unnamed protein product [Symbiodinium natans]|uniref:Uncharacterized protein n=1 Tax=Symbiodinium natans TaxID=878477 RepID=A0A812JEP5_9DINO|nr:unnamed protein product [Symbiodinium natans]
MALPLTLPGFTDPAAGARRMLAAQVEQLNQWQWDGCNSWSGAGGRHEDRNGEAGTMAETVHSVLDWAFSIEGSDLASACRAVRDKLHILDVVQVVQDFIASLLYVTVAAEPQPTPQGQHASTKHQLAEFLYQLCGLSEPSEQSSSSANVRAALVEPCKSCVCCHIAIQETMGFLCFVHHFVTTSSTASMGPEHLPRHIEEGVLLMLHIVVKLCSSVHDDCFLVAQRFDHLQWWPRYERLRRDCPVTSWPLTTWASFQQAWLDMEQAVFKLQKRVALFQMQTGQRSGRRGPRHARPSAGFVSFPPPLPKVELAGS